MLWSREGGEGGGSACQGRKGGITILTIGQKRKEKYGSRRSTHATEGAGAWKEKNRGGGKGGIASITFCSSLLLAVRGKKGKEKR